MAKGSSNDVNLNLTNGFDVASAPTTEVDVPMTKDDVEVDIDADDDDDVDDVIDFFEDVPAVLRRVKLLLMLPQSTGRFARVWNTFR